MSKNKHATEQQHEEAVTPKSDWEALITKLQTEENQAVVQELHNEIAKLKTENDVLRDELKYQVAEMRNALKRRDEKETSLKKYAGTNLGERLIPDVELLNRVLTNMTTNENPELKNYALGFEMVMKKMEASFEEAGIVPMKIVLGSEFDPQFQESVEQVTNDNYQSGQIVEIVNAGYLIHDRVLLHAKVKVAK